jgi:hypothetical protein
MIGLTTFGSQSAIHVNPVTENHNEVTDYINSLLEPAQNATNAEAGIYDAVSVVQNSFPSA